MSQAALFLAFHVIGVALCLAVGPRAKVALCCALGFIVGQAVFGLVVLALLASGVPYRLEIIAPVGAVIALVGAVVAFRRGDLDGAAWRTIGAWTAAFGLVSCALCAVNVTILSYDSHALIMLGRIIGDDGRFADGILSELSSWGVFLPLVQSAAHFLPVEYLYSLNLHTGLSFAVLFALCLHHGLVAMGIARPRALHVLLVTLALVTIFFFQHHFIYVHNNVPAGIYLFAFVALYWLAEVEREPSPLPVAFVCLTAAALHRLELPIFALLFMVLSAFPSRLPRAPILAGASFFTLVIAGWYALLAPQMADAGNFLTVTRCYLVVGITFAVWAACAVAALPRLSALTKRTAPIAAAVCALALTAATASKPLHMAVSAKNWVINLVVSEYWGGAWFAIAALVVLAWPLARAPHAAVFTHGIPVAFGLILLMAYGRTPYRAVHVGDSANRMNLELLPLLFFYLGLKMISALVPRGAADSPGRAAPAAAALDPPPAPAP